MRVTEVEPFLELFTATLLRTEHLQAVLESIPLIAKNPTAHLTT